jgi:hypothetical protein
VQQVLEVAFGGRPDPAGDVGQRLAEQRGSRARPGVELCAQVRHVADAALDGISDDRPDFAQAGQVAHGVTDGPRGEGVMQRSRRPDPLRHPGCAVQPDEIPVLALLRRRDQDVDELRGRSPDAMPTQGGQARNHAGFTRVKRRGHFSLGDGGRPGHGDVHAGQQAAPRTLGTEPMPQRVLGQADSQRLLAGDHVELPV